MMMIILTDHRGLQVTSAGHAAFQRPKAADCHVANLRAGSLRCAAGVSANVSTASSSSAGIPVCCLLKLL